MTYPVILVNVSRLTNQIQFPIGLSVIANTLKHHDITPELIDLIPMDTADRERVFQESIPQEPAIYGFSIMIGGYHLDEVERYAAIIRKQSPDSIIVYGGSLPSSITHAMLERCYCDYVIHGEGEVSFPELVKALNANNREPDDVIGVFYRRRGDVLGVRNKRIRKLDHLSNPDFELFDMDFYVRYLNETSQSWELMASRGCCGKCEFCYKFMGDGLSMRNADYVLDEIEYVMDTYSLNSFYFIDENFLQVTRYFNEFIEKKNDRNLDFKFIVQSRIDAITRPKCEVGSDNGLICISTGIESVSQRTLDQIRKNISISDVEEKIAMMRKYGIKPAVNFIIGFPWETEQDYLDMYDFIERNDLAMHAKLAYLCPLPGTPIFTYAVQNGYIQNEFEFIRNLDNLYWDRHVNLTSLPDSVLDHHYQRLTILGQKEVVTIKSEDYLEQIRELH